MPDTIYLDHNASTPVRPEVAEAMQQALPMMNGTPQSPLAGLLGPSPVFAEPKPKRDTVIIYGLEGGPREYRAEPRQ